MARRKPLPDLVKIAEWMLPAYAVVHPIMPSSQLSEGFLHSSDRAADNLPETAILIIAAKLRSTSSSVVVQFEMLIRIAARPCHCVPPHQQVPSSCTPAMTRWVSSASPKDTST